MRIGQREIGAGRPPYVIAELGVNHDGRPDKAIALVEAAAGAGADAVKLQLFRAEMLMSRAARLAEYQRAAGEHDPIEMLRRLELNAESMKAAAGRARELAMHAIVTVFSVPLVEAAEKIGFDAYKTASPDIVHRPLLARLAATGKPMIVSTGAATLGEVERAAAWLEDVEDLAFLQCVSAYPTPEDRAALGGIVCLAGELDRPVGYSDHTTRAETGGLAAAAGACLLEKHLTLDRAAPGPDHAASLEPADFARYVELARLAQRMLGPSVKEAQEIERDVRTVSRQSMVAARAVKKGEVIRAEDLAFKRPGGGLEPWRAGWAVGKRAARDLEMDEQVGERDLA